MQCGVDLIDVFSGGFVVYQSIDVFFGYQVLFVEFVCQSGWILVFVVGFIMVVVQVEQVFVDGVVDVVFVGCEWLCDLYFVFCVVYELGVEVLWFLQYDCVCWC